MNLREIFPLSVIVISELNTSVNLWQIKCTSNFFLSGITFEVLKCDFVCVINRENFYGLFYSV